jgi:hypothetical protein
MNSGFGIAALIVFFLSLGVPFVGNFITLLALVLVAVAAWNRNVLWPVALVAASAVKLFFLSPSWMILMSQEGGYVVVTLLFLAAPVAVLLFRRNGAADAPELTLPAWPPMSQRPSQAPGQDDIGDWDRIADKNDEDSLQEYLLRHPRGRFAELARMKLERMGVRPLEPQSASDPAQVPAPASAPAQAPSPPADQTPRPRIEPSSPLGPLKSDQSAQIDEPRSWTSVDDEPPRRTMPIAMVIALAAILIGGLGLGGVFAWRELQDRSGARATWASVAKDDPAEIRGFLAGDPGSYRDEALDTLAQLEAQRSREANAANTVEALEQFLADFPDGVHSLAARGRLAELQAAQQQRGQPPTYRGVFVQRGVCPFEGCVYRWWRSTSQVAMYPRPMYPDETVGGLIGVFRGESYGLIQPGEGVTALTGEVHLMPVRGVATAATENLAAGDVVYRLSYLGEGFWSIWRNGEILEASDTNISWDDAGQDRSGYAQGLWWVQVRRADGSEGWIWETDAFACKDQFSGDQGCTP